MQSRETTMVKMVEKWLRKTEKTGPRGIVRGGRMPLPNQRR